MKPPDGESQVPCKLSCLWNLKTHTHHEPRDAECSSKVAWAGGARNKIEFENRNLKVYVCVALVLFYF